MSEPVDLVRLFQLYTFSLQSGQNVPEANAWLTGFLSVESCLEVLLHILGMANDDTCSKFFAAKMIHSLLKNASWTRIHHHRLGEICQIAFHELFAKICPNYQYRRQLTSCVAILLAVSIEICNEATGIHNQSISQLLHILMGHNVDHNLAVLDIFEELPTAFLPRIVNEQQQQIIHAVRNQLNSIMESQALWILSLDTVTFVRSDSGSLRFLIATVRCYSAWFSSPELGSTSSHVQPDQIYPTSSWLSLSHVSNAAASTSPGIDRLLQLVLYFSDLIFNAASMRSCSSDMARDLMDCLTMLFEILRECLLYPSPSDEVLTEVDQPTQVAALNCCASIMKAFLTTHLVWGKVRAAGLVGSAVQGRRDTDTGNAPLLIALVEVSALLVEKHSHLLFGTSALYVEARRRGLATILPSGDVTSAGAAGAAGAVADFSDDTRNVATISTMYSAVVMSCIGLTDQCAAVSVMEALMYLDQQVPRAVEEPLLSSLGAPLFTLLLERASLPLYVSDDDWLLLECSVDSLTTFSALDMDREEACMALLEFRKEGFQLLQAICTKWPGTSSVVPQLAQQLAEVLAVIRKELPQAAQASRPSSASSSAGGLGCSSGGGSLASCGGGGSGGSIDVSVPAGGALFHAGRRLELLLAVLLALLESTSELVDLEDDEDDDSGSPGGRIAEGSGSPLVLWFDILAHVTVAINSTPGFMESFPLVVSRFLDLWAMAPAIIKPLLDSRGGDWAVSLVFPSSSSSGGGVVVAGAAERLTVRSGEVVSCVLTMVCSSLEIAPLRPMALRALVGLTSSMLKHLHQPAAAACEWLLAALGTANSGILGCDYTAAASTGSAGKRAVVGADVVLAIKVCQDAALAEKLHTCLGRLMGVTGTADVERRLLLSSSSLSALASRLARAISLCTTGRAGEGTAAAAGAGGTDLAPGQLNLCVGSAMNSVASLRGLVRGLAESISTLKLQKDAGLHIARQLHTQFSQLSVILTEHMYSLMLTIHARGGGGVAGGGAAAAATAQAPRGEDKLDACVYLLRQMGALLSKTLDGLPDVTGAADMTVALAAELIPRLGPLVSAQSVPVPGLIVAATACFRHGSDSPQLVASLSALMSECLNKASAFLATAQAEYSVTGDFVTLNRENLVEYIVETCKACRQVQTVGPVIWVTPLSRPEAAADGGGGSVCSATQFFHLAKQIVDSWHIFSSVDLLRAFGATWSQMLAVGGGAAGDMHMSRLYPVFHPHLVGLFCSVMSSFLFNAPDRFIKPVVGMLETLLKLLYTTSELQSALVEMFGQLRLNLTMCDTSATRPIFQVVDVSTICGMVYSTILAHGQQATDAKVFTMIIRKALTAIAQLMFSSSPENSKDSLLVWPRGV